MSLQIIKSIPLDFSKDPQLEHIFVKAGDKNSRILDIIPLNDGLPFSIPNGTEISMVAQAENGRQISNEAKLEDNGHISVPLNQKILSADDFLTCEVRLSNGDTESLSSQYFYLKVLQKIRSESDSTDPVFQNKTVHIIANGSQTITADTEYDGLDQVQVNVNVPIPDGYIQPSGTKEITENGPHDVTNYESVEVNVPNEIPEGYIKPGGTAYITHTAETDVSSYQYAQIQDKNLIPENIKKGISILGIDGAYEASGGGIDYPIIKAGNYRFNDTPTISKDVTYGLTFAFENSDVDVYEKYYYISLISDFEGSSVVSYGDHSFVYSYGAWEIYAAGSDCEKSYQNITVPYDQIVEQEFYDWFFANTGGTDDPETSTGYTVSGTYTLTDESYPSWDSQRVNGDFNGTTFDELRWEANEYYIILLYDGGHVGYCTLMDGIDIGSSFDFGDTEQEVSEEFYSWLTQNTTRE